VAHRGAAVGGDFGRDAAGRRGVAIDGGNGGALLREQPGDGRADARAGPGHDGDLPLQIEHSGRGKISYFSG
jgi:hypothetical protein